MPAARLAAYIDCSDMRLGDRMAAAWFAQHRRRHTGERFGVFDDGGPLAECMPLPRYFPLTFEALSARDRRTLPKWDQGMLWLTARNAFARDPVAGRFEFVPPEILRDAERQRKIHPSAGPRVLMHVLDDASYNRRRNWQRHDASALARRLRQQGCQVTLLNPRRGEFIGSLPHMMAQMLATDIFIGGDSGPSHVFAMLCADKPQIAIYPDMSVDQATYAAQQQELGLPLPWSSHPLRRSLRVIQLRRGGPRLIHRGGLRFDLRRCSRFDPAEVARAVLDALDYVRTAHDAPALTTAPHPQ